MQGLTRRRMRKGAAVAGIAAFAAAAASAALANEAAEETGLPDIAQALLQAAYDTGDPAEIAAVARAVKAVFPDYVEAIEAHSQEILAQVMLAQEKLTAPAPPQEAAPDALAAPLAADAASPDGAPADAPDASDPATETPPRPRFYSLRPWDGKINASGLFSDGNSENIAGGLAVEGVRKAGPLTHNIRGFFDIGRSGGITNQKRWGASYQLDFQIGDATYAYSRVSYEEDEFSGFDYRLFVGAGLGHFYYDTETLTWKVEAGPGFRYSPIDDTREIEQEAAFYASNEVDWVIREGVTFEQDLNVTWTEPTTTYRSVTALNTKLTDAISTGLSFEYRYETDPPQGRENFDAIARASLIYGF